MKHGDLSIVFCMFTRGYDVSWFGTMLDPSVGTESTLLLSPIDEHQTRSCGGSVQSGSPVSD